MNRIAITIKIIISYGLLGAKYEQKLWHAYNHYLLLLYG